MIKRELVLINPVRNSREVLRPPREWSRAVTHAAEWRSVISNGINR
ncbi:MAG: hypothetical protein UX68_C0009G0011 [Parcubacteria group bacterium GW2011_GWA2_46_9]|nr:MAG: hypothetical protein UX68_C0009G0011 [Parcubacteria group bacterium GW2011_GWA2_46_9]